MSLQNTGSHYGEIFCRYLKKHLATIAKMDLLNYSSIDL